MGPFPGAAKSPNFKPKWRKPSPTKILKTWPPVPETPHNVDYILGSENFWSLARQHGRANPWDIIIYNFRTEDPEEVNWYLHHAVGCWQSEDRANFSFKDAERDDGEMSKIYIPPKTWKPAPSFKKGSGAGVFLQGIQDAAANILTGLAGRMPTITWRQSTLTPTGLRKVADVIRSKDVIVVVEPIAQGSAFYFIDQKVIIVSRVPAVGDTDMAESLANEAVHVFAHMREKDVAVFRNEVISSLSQSLAAVILNKDRMLRMMKSDQMNAMLYFAAWVWSEDLGMPSRLGQGELDREFTHPVYGETFNAWQLLLEYHMKIPNYAAKANATWKFTW